MEELDARHRPDMVVFIAARSPLRDVADQSIDIVGTPLYNPDRRLRQLPDPGRTDRHLFQTLMMVIGMISGKGRYTGSILYYSRHGLGFAGWPASC